MTDHQPPGWLPRSGQYLPTGSAAGERPRRIGFVPRHQRKTALFAGAGSELLSPIVRGAAVDRAMTANVNHARHGLEYIGTATAVGPYCLVIMSVENLGYTRISFASRLEDDDPDHGSLSELLADVTYQAVDMTAQARRTGQSWDPRTPLDGLVLRSDPFNRSTKLIGVGVSILDMPQEPWATIKERWHKATAGERRIEAGRTGGQGKIVLLDGTAVHFVRRPMVGEEVYATSTIDQHLRTSTLEPELVTRATELGDFTWLQLRELLEVFLANESAQSLQKTI